MDLHFIIKIIIFAYLTLDSLPLSTNSTSCLPQNCGNGPNITFPFWITQQQESSCGSIGFNITCKNSYPIIMIANEDHVVKDIFYTNFTFLVVNANYFNVCPTPIRNFSLNGTPFSYNDLSIDFYLYYNCSNPYEEKHYSVDCATNGSSFSSFAVYHPEILEEKNYSVNTCQTMVHVPVHLDSLNVLLYENYTDVLRKGFVLEWECSNCEKHGTKTNWRIKGFIGIGSALLMLVLIFVIYRILKVSPNNRVTLFKHRTDDDRNVEAFVVQYGSLTTKRYKYVDVKKMTNSFKVKLGQGGFGTVFKGKLSDGRLVAVKVLSSSKSTGNEFINEVSTIGRTSHVNIVNLLGFCFEYKKRALIYEFMPNGSLEKIINGHAPMKTGAHIGVDKLYEIAFGIAHGLDYLHRGCNTRILHLDIKPHNILLDEDFCPKIADFGLAKLYSMKDSIVSMFEARGTIGYIAPEVFNRNFGGVSHKSDVYSYGMLILEMVGGREKGNADIGSGQTSEYFPDWIYNCLEKDDFLLDSVTTTQEKDYARKMILVGLWCIQAYPGQRPSIDEVIKMLEGSMEELKVPPKPFFYTPPRSPATKLTASESEPESNYS